MLSGLSKYTDVVGSQLDSGVQSQLLMEQNWFWEERLTLSEG